MENYPIPQFIEQEGKIIYFITFRQFFILIAGGAACFITYYSLPFSFAIILIILEALITGVVGFLKINDMLPETVAMHFFHFILGHKDYTWKKKEAAYPFKIQKRTDIRGMGENTTLAPQKSKLHDIKRNVELRVKQN